MSVALPREDLTSNHRHRTGAQGWRIVGVIATVALMCAACSDSGVATTTSVAEGSNTLTPATATTASQTVAPATSSTEASTATSVEDERLVYVSLGPSGNFFPSRTTGMVFLYADTLAEQFDAIVDHRDHTIGGDTAPSLLHRMRTSDRLRQDLAEADAVTLMFPIDHWVSALQTSSGYAGRDPTSCGGADNEQCLRDAAIIDRQHVDDILAELTLQCPPDEILIRIADAYMIHSEDQAAAGSLETVIPYWRAAQEYIDAAAADYGIPVAHVFEALNGPDGLDDPQEKGLMLDDQEHPNEAGARLMADLVAGLGYDFAG